MERPAARDKSKACFLDLKPESLSNPAMAAFQTSQDGDIHILSVSGRLEPQGGKDLKDTMESLTASGERQDLIVDLTELTYMASAGFRELFMIGRKLSRQNGRLVVCGLRGEVKRVFELARFDTAYPIFEDRGAAIIYLRAA